MRVDVEGCVDESRTRLDAKVAGVIDAVAYGVRSAMSDVLLHMAIMGRVPPARPNQAYVRPSINSGPERWRTVADEWALRSVCRD